MKQTRKRPIYIAAALLVLVVVGLLFFGLHKPERSVASYCKVYGEQSNILAHATGDTYSVKVFSHSSSDPGDFVNAFSKLEAVAPKEIEPDVTTLKKTFQSIKDNPSSAISASLSGLGAEDSVKNWTKIHCGMR
ncbi:MAG: hypothetical protein WBP22_02575 [Candidatus Saccharimonas sp.]